MTSKHTPGPWSIRDTYEVWAHKGAVKIADVSLKYSTLNQAQYTARLIAEAPAMLEALRELEAAITFSSAPEIHVKGAIVNRISAILSRIDGKE